MGVKSPGPPKFLRNKENTHFEKYFSEKYRPTILQSYKLFSFQTYINNITINKSNSYMIIIRYKLNSFYL